MYIHAVPIAYFTVARIIFVIWFLSIVYVAGGITLQHDSGKFVLLSYESSNHTVCFLCDSLSFPFGTITYSIQTNHT